MSGVNDTERYAQFLASSGLKPEDVQSLIIPMEKTTDELLPTQLDENVDYNEHPTDLQIKDGLNRLKLLALKVISYTHVTSGSSSMASIFQRDLTEQKATQFHLIDE